MRLIVSTCGTSLLTKIADEQRQLVTRYANACHPEEIPEPDRVNLLGLIEAARQRMQAASHEERAKLSAEYNGLACYYGHAPDPRDQHWLIASDTWLGQQTAAILEEVLGRSAQTKRIADLRTKDLQAFRLAMAALVRLCAEEIKPLGMNVVFNLTGGFKSVQGFMQALGMLYADETIYVFESSHELLRLPRLPLRLDVETPIRETLNLWRRLDVGLPVTEREVRGLPEIFFLVIDGQVALSEWGELAWREVRDKLLGEQIWPSIDAKVRLGEGFERSSRHCSEDERRQINERIAELARHLNDPTFNPRHLDFKKLATPHLGSTHECDAWASGGARRLFGHFEQDSFVIDRLAEGLH